MATIARSVRKELSNLIPSQEGPQNTLSEAMRYSSIEGGKRLRPFLLVKSANLFNVPFQQSIRVAAAVELIHCYSLVHDDLPAMDDDDLRRGKPTNHKVFGEATAILAGNALLTLAFESLNKPDRGIEAGIRCQLSQKLAEAAGMKGLVGGQILDIGSENHILNESEISQLQQLKTGALFRFSAEAGVLLGSGEAEDLRALSNYADALGMAFQITDDLLDVEGQQEKPGKRTRKDGVAGKATFVSLLGVESARTKAQDLIETSVQCLNRFDDRAEDLRKLSDFILTRTQ